ncbi:hypothetical protein Hanom_Chr14g01316541 [Helianthus anomalus]
MIVIRKPLLQKDIGNGNNISNSLHAYLCIPKDITLFLCMFNLDCTQIIFFRKMVR